MSLVENNQIQHKDIETAPITSLNKVQLIAKVTLLEEIVQTKVRREAEIEQITQQLQEVMKQKIADIEQRLEQKVADFLASTEPDNNFAERFE